MVHHFVKAPSANIARATDLDKANARELRTYGKYLSRIMQRLARHKLLPENNRVALNSGDERLRKALVRKSDLPTMIDAIRKSEELSIQPAIKILDKLAEWEVRDSVRDIMLGVTLSPWRTIDLFVVLYRNGEWSCALPASTTAGQGCVSTS